MKLRELKLSKRDIRQIFRKLRMNQGKTGEWIVKTKNITVYITKTTPNGSATISTRPLDSGTNSKSNFKNSIELMIGFKPERRGRRTPPINPVACGRRTPPIKPRPDNEQAEGGN